MRILILKHTRPLFLRLFLVAAVVLAHCCMFSMPSHAMAQGPMVMSAHGSMASSGVAMPMHGVAYAAVSVSVGCSGVTECDGLAVMPSRTIEDSVVMVPLPTPLRVAFAQVDVSHKAVPLPPRLVPPSPDTLQVFLI
ncbi:MAG: hypothetical protein ACE5FN_00580 [Leptospirillia bacterium]